MTKRLPEIEDYLGGFLYMNDSFETLSISLPYRIAED